LWESLLISTSVKNKVFGINEYRLSCSFLPQRVQGFCCYRSGEKDFELTSSSILRRILENHVFQIMPPDVEFNSTQNELIVKSKSKTIMLYRIKKKNIDIMQPEKRFFGFFCTFFTSNVFLVSISTKILKHISHDTEFCNIFEISAAVSD